MTADTISVTLDPDLRRELDEEVADGDRSAVVAQAIRDYLDRKRITAAAEWHASLTGDTAAALTAFDAQW